MLLLPHTLENEIKYISDGNIPEKIFLYFLLIGKRKTRKDLDVNQRISEDIEINHRHN